MTDFSYIPGSADSFKDFYPGCLEIPLRFTLWFQVINLNCSKFFQSEPSHSVWIYISSENKRQGQVHVFTEQSPTPTNIWSYHTHSNLQPQKTMRCVLTSITNNLPQRTVLSTKHITNLHLPVLWFFCIRVWNILWFIIKPPLRLNSIRIFYFGRFIFIPSIINLC